jgi:hypothetical protein
MHFSEEEIQNIDELMDKLRKNGILRESIIIPKMLPILWQDGGYKYIMNCCTMISPILSWLMKYGLISKNRARLQKLMD